MWGMEFNIEADLASARLRRGISQHTLLIGDHDTTAMINGGTAALQRLAFDILTATGVTVDSINRLAGLQTKTVQPHDYEPSDTTHPMSTDPDCRVCGQPRRACERKAR